MKVSLFLFLASVCLDGLAAELSENVSVVRQTPGLVSFWDFVKRESGGGGRFTAYVPEGCKEVYSLEAGNYVRDYWGRGVLRHMGIFLCWGVGLLGKPFESAKRRILPSARFYLSRGSGCMTRHWTLRGGENR